MSSATELMLPCGLDEEGARVERRVEIQKIKGRAQRDLAEFSARKNGNTALLLEAVLKSTVVSIGGKPLNSDHLLKLYLADRDWILFEAQKLSKTVITVEDKCSTCEAETTVPDVDLNGLEVTSVKDDILWWAPDGQVLGQDELNKLSPDERIKFVRRVFRLENPALKTKALFSYPRGKQHREIGTLGDRPVEALWKLMAMTCIEWEDPDHVGLKVPLGGLSATFWDDVDNDILVWLEEIFAESMPGVNSRIKVTCPAGHTFETVLQPVGFMFPRRTPTI